MSATSDGGNWSESIEDAYKESWRAGAGGVGGWARERAVEPRGRRGIAECLAAVSSASNQRRAGNGGSGRGAMTAVSVG